MRILSTATLVIAIYLLWKHISHFSIGVCQCRIGSIIGRRTTKDGTNRFLCCRVSKNVFRCGNTRGFFSSPSTPLQPLLVFSSASIYKRSSLLVSRNTFRFGLLIAWPLLRRSSIPLFSYRFSIRLLSYVTLPMVLHSFDVRSVIHHWNIPRYDESSSCSVRHQWEEMFRLQWLSTEKNYFSISISPNTNGWSDFFVYPTNREKGCARLQGRSMSQPCMMPVDRRGRLTIVMVLLFFVVFCSCENVCLKSTHLRVDCRIATLFIVKVERGTCFIFVVDLY